MYAEEANMQEKPQLSRVEFHLLSARCAIILKENGFPVRTAGESDHIELLTEWAILKTGGWLGSVEPVPAPEEVNPAPLTVPRLERIVLECAPFFKKHNAWYGESVSANLNGIKLCMLEILQRSGDVIPGSEEALRQPSHWACYKLYEEIARHCGMSGTEIILTRTEAREQHGAEYQE
jgi:hypothetical protein